MIEFESVVAIEPRPTPAMLVKVHVRLLRAAAMIGRRSVVERDELRALAKVVRTWLAAERKAT